MDMDPSPSPVVCTTVTEFLNQLRRPGAGISVVAVLMPDPEQLAELVAGRELLDSIRVILVLPDDRPETVAQGHMLRPRFITSAGNEQGQVAMVLARMINVSQHRLPEEAQQPI